jgi:hypothetical protein
MVMRENPGLERNTRSIGAAGYVLATHFHDADLLLNFLREDVAEHATLFGYVVIPGGAEFIQHASRNECRADDLRSGMVELLPGYRSVILEDADVLEATVTLEILYSLCAKDEELLNLSVRGDPEMSVVSGVLDEDLVRADGLHGVVQALASAGRIALDVIDGRRMNDRAGRPGAAIDGRHG